MSLLNFDSVIDHSSHFVACPLDLLVTRIQAPTIFGGALQFSLACCSPSRTVSHAWCMGHALLGRRFVRILARLRWTRIRRHSDDLCILLRHTVAARCA